MNSDHSQQESQQQRESIFFCDVTAEAGRLMMKLRLLGYHVVDVPLATLASRTAYEIPKLVICDAEAPDVTSEIQAAHEAATSTFSIIFLSQPTTDTSHLKLLKSYELLSRPVETSRLEKLVKKLAGPPSKVRDEQGVRQSSNARRSSLLASSFRRASSAPALQGREQPQLLTEENPLLLGQARASALTTPPQRLVYQSIFPIEDKPIDDDTRFSQGTHRLLNQAREKIAEHPVQPPRPERLGQGVSNGNIEQRFIDALSAPLEEDIEASDQTGTADNSKKAAVDQNTSAGGKRISEFPFDAERAQIDNASSSLYAKSEQLKRAEQLLQAPLVEPQPESIPSELLAQGAMIEQQRPTTAPRPMAHDDSLDHQRHLAGVQFNSEAAQINHEYSAAYPPLTTEKVEPRDLISTTPPQRMPPLSTEPQVALQQSLDEPDSFFSSTSSHRGPTSLAASKSDDNLEQPLDLNLVLEPSSLEPGQSAPIIDLIASMVRLRKSGSVAEEVPGTLGGIRRILFRDGDILTLHSSAGEESLVEFLKSTGAIRTETARALSNVPKAGRYAGAALVARGVLSQEELWGTLRSHAEWLLGRMISIRAVGTYEEKSPPQLAEEPAVFGGSAGAEIFVEVIKRVISPETSYEKLGGGERILGRGQYELLISETALSDLELNAATACLGKNLASVLQTQPNLLITVYALAELGIFSTGTQSTGEVIAASKEQPAQEASRFPAAVESSSAESKSSALSEIEFEKASHQLDLKAFVSKLESRLDLVKDGNYFEILGIAPSATSYEVQRAAEHLRTEFSESNRSLEQLNLMDAIRLLLSTVAEAELVLQNEVRRKRYRLALEQHPASH